MHSHLLSLPQALLLLLLFASSCQAQVIRDFKSDMSIQATGDVDVAEEIKIDFGEKSSRNQFFRVIPTWYDALKEQSNPHHRINRVDINIKKVTMDGDKPVPFQSWATDRELYITIGGEDPEQTFKNQHTFQIAYQVHKGVYFAGGQPSLYLSATGEQWPFAIDNASVNVTPPSGTDLARVKGTSLIGAGGEYKENPGTIAGNKITFSARDIRPAEDLTIMVSLPGGSVVSTSVLQDLTWNLQRFYQVIALPLLTIIVLTTWWSFYGRDPKSARSEEGIAWQPPEYLTPAEVGTLIDESCDLIDVVSTLFDLAVRGFVKIKVIPYSGFLYLGNKDYELTLLRPANDRELKPHEQLFLAAIFGLSTTNYISAVRGTFAEFLPLMKQRVYTSLVEENVFARDPELDRKIFIAVGAAVVTAGIGLMLASTYQAAGQATAGGTILSGLILILAARAMPKRTARGVEALNQIKQFKQTLADGQKELVEKTAREQPDTFNKLLPYAIVLGVADQWAKIFSATLSEYPDWYEIDPSLKRANFSAVQFVSELGEGLNIINRALTETDRGILSALNVQDLLGMNK